MFGDTLGKIIQMYDLMRNSLLKILIWISGNDKRPWDLWASKEKALLLEILEIASKRAEIQMTADNV